MEVNLVNVLQCAASQNSQEIKLAEEYLRELETKDGFYSQLLNVFYNRSYDINIRWLAIIYFKNGVENYWRGSRSFTGERKLIVKEEKAYIRHQLLNNLNEPIKQLAMQVAIIISKIVRIEHKKSQSLFLKTLMDIVKTKDQNAQYQSLLTTYLIIKELWSISLPSGKMMLVDLCQHLFQYYIPLWDMNMQSLFILASTNEATVQVIQSQLDITMLCTRILKRMFYKIQNGSLSGVNVECNKFVELIFQYVKTAMECRQRLLSRNILSEQCDKMITSMIKVLRMRVHDLQFSQRIYELALYYCFTAEGQCLSFDKFSLHCLLLITMDEFRISEPDSWRYTETGMEMDTPKESETIRRMLFTPEKQKELCLTLISRYLISNNIDDFHFQVSNEGGNTWKLFLKPCARHVFVKLFKEFREVFTTTIIELVKSQCQPLNPHDLSTILLKDAIYNAMGICAFDLYDQVNFEEWLQVSLIPELRLTGEHSCILRSRIYWLIGKWIGVKCGQEVKADIYRIFKEGLTTETDLGVRMSICFALKNALHDFYFEHNKFLTYLQPTFTAMFILLKDMDDCDNKMRILAVLTDIIELMSNSIKGSVLRETLMEYLPVLWQEFSDHHLLRCAVVTISCKMIRILATESMTVHPFIIGIIRESCDMDQEGSVYYLEDGLELWLTMLDYTPRSSPEIMDLLRNIPTLIDRSAENLKIVLKIIKHYIILDAQEFSNSYASVIFGTINSIISDLQSEGVEFIMKIAKLYLIACPEFSIEILKPLFPRAFVLTFFEPDPSISCNRACVLLTVRLFLFSQDLFVQIMNSLASDFKLSHQMIHARVFDTWINFTNKFVGLSEDLQIISLALCSQLSPSPPLIPNFMETAAKSIDIIIKTLNDIDNQELDLIADFSVVMDSINLDSGYEFEVSEYTRRKNKLIQTDPLQKISLKNLLESQLMSFKQKFGDQQFDILMNYIGDEALQQLNQYIKLKPDNDANSMLQV